MMPDLLAPSEIIILVIVFVLVLGAITAAIALGRKVLLSSRQPSADSEPVEDGAVRASVTDRERALEMLREGTAQGRLTFDELEERIDSVQSATTLGELAELTRDLPRRR